MSRIDSINRERLLWCAAERGLSLDKVAADAGISSHAITRLMEDEVGLTFVQLRRLADYFGRGVLFFLDGGPVEEQRVHTIQYRTLTNQKPDLSNSIRKLIERVERQRELYLALREDLHIEDYQAFAPVDVQPNNTATAAAAVRTWLGLGNTSTFDAFRAAVEAKGILVFRSNGYAGSWQISKESSILGFSLYREDCPVIFVKKTRWETQQTFTLMHELGHIMLHRESSIDDEADMHSRTGHEREANSFAGHLLVPTTWLGQIKDAERPENVDAFDVWLTPYRRAWGVSSEVILRRLLDVGRLSQDAYAKFRVHVQGLVLNKDESGGSRQYRHREPRHIFGDSYVRTVLTALEARRITATKACRYLDGVKLSDLHSLERYVAST